MNPFAVAGIQMPASAQDDNIPHGHLMRIAERNGLGRDLVVQTAFGDSGHTTFFISSQADFDRHADEIVKDPEVKIMKRINCRGATLEACATQSGTLVGPLLTEVVGARELTPYKGCWCGNEVFPGAFTEGVREKARQMAERFGNQLLEEGYRGYFMSEDGSVAYQRFDYERRAIYNEREAFFLRITGPGDYRYEGADLGILITRGRSMDDNFRLNIRARDWIRGIQNHYAGKPIVTTQHELAPAPGSFKIL
ncbi:hypothetical protein [Aquincola sp. J276]|uniref:hypothetical protein n=1 Tax=Aquincola sp. J276 TaxID=2898432 RepID=UPI002151DAFB|nr:hypothetical protein [Aquincola sp. J276]MCR5867485.1 hypothetical protein [Aquincola sp. J276]